MIKDDYIVRIWPSGTITMGKVHFRQTKSDADGDDNRPMFKALESYSNQRNRTSINSSNEGSVTKDHVYGYADYNTSYKHRLATPVEIQVFHLYGLNKKEGEIKQLHRQIVLESIV
jgi:hypothetical protein